MRRMLRDFVGMRRHRPFQVRGEVHFKVNCAGCVLPSSIWAGGDSVAVYCCWLCYPSDSCQLHSSLLPPQTSCWCCHFTYKIISQWWNKAAIETINSTFSTMTIIQLNISSTQSNPCICIYGRPVSCDWLGGSVMLADVSFTQLTLLCYLNSYIWLCLLIYYSFGSRVTGTLRDFEMFRKFTQEGRRFIVK